MKRTLLVVIALVSAAGWGGVGAAQTAGLPP